MVEAAHILCDPVPRRGFLSSSAANTREWLFSRLTADGAVPAHELTVILRGAGDSMLLSVGELEALYAEYWIAHTLELEPADSMAKSEGARGVLVVRPPASGSSPARRRSRKYRSQL